MQVPHLLSVLVWLPILGATAVLAFGRQANVARWLALAVSLATFVLSIPLWTGYEATGPVMQFVESFAWIPAIRSYYALGADGISVAMIVLTSFTSVLVVISDPQLTLAATGGGVIVHVNVAGVGSTLASGSIACTAKVCSPTARPV